MDTIRRDHEIHGRRRGRNVGVLVALLAFVGLSFAVTVVKLAAHPEAGLAPPPKTASQDARK